MIGTPTDGERLTGDARGDGGVMITGLRRANGSDLKSGGMITDALFLVGDINGDLNPGVFSGLLLCGDFNAGLGDL
jgi:hypothetical protein